MGAVGRYVHDVKWTGSEALSTTYADVELAGVRASATQLTGIYLYVTTISSATALTVGISRDAGGDEWLMPPTAVDLSTGVTTATDGSAVIEMALDRPALSSTSVYLWAKTDTGTCTLVEAHLLEQE